MKTISTSKARMHIGNIVDDIRENNSVVGLTRHNIIDAVIIKFPKEYRSNFSEVSNMNLYGGSFDFLKNEPALYSLKDVKK